LPTGNQLLLEILMEKDEWYSPTVAKNGQPVRGAAALNVRIARAGGMKAVAQRIGAKAAQDTLDEINQAVAVKRPALRLVRRTG
jgi:hypothetical protein